MRRIGCGSRQDADSEGAWTLCSSSCELQDGGCNYMDCPNCRRHFCWSCGPGLKSLTSTSSRRGQIMKASHQDCATCGPRSAAPGARLRCGLRSLGGSVHRVAVRRQVVGKTSGGRACVELTRPRLIRLKAPHRSLWPGSS